MDTYTDFRILHNKIDDGYGREEEGLVHDVSQVNIPESHLEISHRQYELLCQQLDPLSPSDNYGIEIYQGTLQLILLVMLYVNNYCTCVCINHQ